MFYLPSAVFRNIETQDNRQRIAVVGFDNWHETPAQPTFDEVYATAYHAISEVLYKLPQHQLNHFYQWAEQRRNAEGDTLREFATWMYEREAWSRDTFGLTKDRGPIGPAKHLAKEAQEFIEANGKDSSLEEIADMQFLVLDILTRSGYNFGELVEALKAKLEINRSREWPKGNPDDAIEHDRTKEASSVHGSDPGESG